VIGSNIGWLRSKIFRQSPFCQGRDARFNHNGEQPNNRAMQDRWAERKVDNKTLFDLFPGNPSKQAGKVAGLPESMRKGGY